MTTPLQEAFPKCSNGDVFTVSNNDHILYRKLSGREVTLVSDGGGRSPKFHFEDDYYFIDLSYLNLKN